MRLGIIYLGKSGGICHYTYELARALCGLTKLAIFIAPQNVLLDDFRNLACDLKIVEFDRGSKSILKAMVAGGEAKKVASQILDYSPDVVLDTGSEGWCNVTMKWLAGKTVTAAVIHDVYPHPGIQYLKNALPSFACPLAADAIVTLSRFAYRQAQKRYPEKTIIESRHGVIHNSQDVDLHSVSALRKKLLFFGSIDAYKGIEYLVKAFIIVKHTLPDITLTIAGKGSLPDTALSDIKTSGVNFINRYIPDDEVDTLFASHGLLILPYTSATQSGVAAAGLANGLPAIATNTGALPEQIINGRNGIIVPPRNSKALAKAIIDIVEDESKFMHMAEQSLNLGQTEYSWDNIAQELLDELSLPTSNIQGKS